MTLIELLTLTLRTIPNTCTYRPGQLRLRVMWPVYLAVWTTVGYVLPTFAVRALGDPAETLALLGGVGLIYGALRIWRLSRVRRLTRLVYEDVEPSVTTTIDLSPSATG